jgi:hypothetical protein
MDSLISRQAAIDASESFGMLDGYADQQELIYRIRQLPSAESIVRCKDCKHREEKPIADGRYWCEIHDTFMYYCSDAERRDDDQDQ